MFLTVLLWSSLTLRAELNLYQPEKESVPSVCLTAPGFWVRCYRLKRDSGLLSWHRTTLNSRNNAVPAQPVHKIMAVMNSSVSWDRCLCGGWAVPFLLRSRHTSGVSRGGELRAAPSWARGAQLPGESPAAPLGGEGRAGGSGRMDARDGHRQVEGGECINRNEVGFCLSGHLSACLRCRCLVFRCPGHYPP